MLRLGEESKGLPGVPGDRGGGCGDVLGGDEGPAVAPAPPARGAGAREAGSGRWGGTLGGEDGAVEGHVHNPFPPARPGTVWPWGHPGW